MQNKQKNPFCESQRFWIVGVGSSRLGQNPNFDRKLVFGAPLPTNAPVKFIIKLD